MTRPRRQSRRASGIALLLTLVLLVVLSTLVYTVSTRVFAQRRRMSYMINHAKAQYACDSALKCFEASLKDFAPELIARPNEPDFSDLFAYDEEQYQAFLEEWIADETAQLSYKQGLPQDSNGADPNGAGSDLLMVDALSADQIQVRGPYEPNWPWVQPRIEFDLDDTTGVTIEISDENAKYPLAWMALDDENLTRQISSGFEGFMEWMDFEPSEVDGLKEQLAQVAAVKPFKMEFKPITKVERQPAARRTPPTGSALRRRTTTTNRSRQVRTTMKRTTISAAQQKAEQDTDYVRLLTSSLVDTELLARPTLISDSRRNESAHKYIGLFGTMQVNINTAPRHVLEAAFAFCGGDAVDIADLVIQARRIKPIADFEELKKIAFSYADSIENCEKFVVTASTVFSVRVEAKCGAASVSKILVVTKSGDTIKKLALLSG